MTPLVLLDRDGTIIVERHYLADPDGVELLPGAARAIAQLRESGARVAVVSNQSGVARGYFTRETVDRIHDRVSALLEQDGARIDGFFVCPHHPDDGCACRKPAPGLARQAASALGGEPAFVVGDNVCDIELGRAIGATTILVRTGYGSKVSVSADHVVDDLAGAAEVIANALRRRP